MPITSSFIVTANSQADLAATLVQAGVLVFQETGPQAVAPNLFSWIGQDITGKAHGFCVITVADQPTLDAVFASIGAEKINLASAPLRLVAGGIAPKEISYRSQQILTALEKLSDAVMWDEAITAATVVARDKALFFWWSKVQAMTLLEPQFLAILTEFATLKGHKSQAETDTWIADLIAIAVQVTD